MSAKIRIAFEVYEQMSTALTTNSRDLVLAGPIGSLDAYVSTVNAIPVLSREDEIRLASDFREHNDLVFANVGNCVERHVLRAIESVRNCDNG